MTEYKEWFDEKIKESKTIDTSNFVRDNTEAKIYKFVRVIEIMATDEDEAIDKLRTEFNDFGLSRMDEHNFPLKKVSKLTKHAKDVWETFDCMFTCKKCGGVIFGTATMNEPCKDHIKDEEKK